MTGSTSVKHLATSYLHTRMVEYDLEAFDYFEPRTSHSHRSLRCNENCFQFPKSCSRYRAMYLELCCTITSNILFLLMVLLTLICTPFSVFYVTFFGSIKMSSFMCGKFLCPSRPPYGPQIGRSLLGLTVFVS
jgi:hypothetical protein